MIPEILFELCSGQKCGLRMTDGPTVGPTDVQTDRPTNKCKAIYPCFFEGGHNKLVKEKKKTCTKFACVLRRGQTLNFLPGTKKFVIKRISNIQLAFSSAGKTFIT